jgi:DNA-binding CsgD family transcriptional regulator
MSLLGRDKECAALGRIQVGVAAGASQVLVLRGDPGAGKSALLEYLRDALADWHVLSASGVESETDLAYSGLHQLLAPLIDKHLGRLPDPQRDALATTLGVASGSPPDPFLVGLATLSLLADAADQQPLVCLIDDGQWLDQASIQVLSFVARRLLAERIAMVCATRTGQERDILVGLPELAVPGLSDLDARTLLLNNIHGPVDSAVVDQIVAESHGNPLALLELPRAWHASDLAGGFGLPDTATTTYKIERSYMRRLDLLSPATRLLVLAAAAEPLGDPMLLSRAAGLLGTSLTVAHPAVDVGLLKVGDRVSFAHPLARSAAYHHGSTEHRHQVHQALATATDPETDPDRRAWHLARATVGPDEDVAAELERSADRAQARGGIAAAAAFLTRAMELTPKLVDRNRRALDAAFANVEAGAFETARRLLAIANRGPIEEGQRAKCELLGAQLILVATRGNDAAGPLLTAARRLETTNIALARETYVDAFTASLFGARLNELVDVRDVAAAARAAPRSRADNPSSVDLLLDAFTAITGDYEQAVPVCQAAVRQLRLDRRSPEAELRWFWHGTVLALELWDDESAYHLSEHHTKVARNTGALSQLALGLSSHTPVVVFRGELSAGDFAVAEAESVQEATGIQTAPYGALMVLAWRGLERETKDMVEATVHEATSRGEGIGVAVAEYAHAVLCNSLGQYEEALAAALHATQDSRELVAHNWSLSELVEAAARSDRSDLAVQAHRRLARKAQATGTNWALGLEARARALIGGGDRAEDSYRQAIACLNRTSVRSELARTHLLYGEWLRRANRRVDARNELTTAHESLTAMRMEAFAERARGELLATGAKVRKRKVAAEDAMTPQEAQIARLARDGLTNIEIGAQLFLSARTVEWHLRKVFRKLNIGSRHQLAAVLSHSDRAVTPA